MPHSVATLPSYLPAPLAGHQEALQRLTAYLLQCKQEDRTAKLVFVCTHNSRRSQLAEAWAWYHSLQTRLDVQVYSAGTEATALAAPVVPTLNHAGFCLQCRDDAENPRWRIMHREAFHTLWSKTLDHPTLPREGFAAIMVCSHADANCPFVPGAEVRIALPFEDPKRADGTPEQDSAYLATSRQLAAELHTVFQAASAKR